jgi:hypothetical protein
MGMALSGRSLPEHAGTAADVAASGMAAARGLVALEHLYEIFSMGLSELLVPPRGHHAAINVEGQQLTSETITQNLRAMDGMWMAGRARTAGGRRTGLRLVSSPGCSTTGG